MPCWANLGTKVGVESIVVRALQANELRDVSLDDLACTSVGKRCQSFPVGEQIEAGPNRDWSC